MSEHDDLWRVCQRLTSDYHPYGTVKRWADKRKDYPDCSGGCRFFRPLVNHGYGGRADPDWGVCTNPNSHRAGLLTFEHQGCLKFER